METFAPARDFVEDPTYARARGDALAALELAAIDDPIVGLVSEFATIPHCFTLQCCYGHFVCGSDQDPQNCDPIPDDCAADVRYRIAYVALCIERSPRGLALRKALSRVPGIDPGYVQFGSPDWFWKRWPNSYALQVEPAIHQSQDEAIVDVAEARHIQEVRGSFFARLRELVREDMRAAEQERHAGARKR